MRRRADDDDDALAAVVAAERRCANIHWLATLPRRHGADAVLGWTRSSLSVSGPAAAGVASPARLVPRGRRAGLLSDAVDVFLQQAMDFAVGGGPCRVVVVWDAPGCVAVPPPAGVARRYGVLVCPPPRTSTVVGVVVGRGDGPPGSGLCALVAVVDNNSAPHRAVAHRFVLPLPPLPPHLVSRVLDRPRFRVMVLLPRAAGRSTGVGTVVSCGRLLDVDVGGATTDGTAAATKTTKTTTTAAAVGPASLLFRRPVTTTKKKGHHDDEAEEGKKDE